MNLIKMFFERDGIIYSIIQNIVIVLLWWSGWNILDKHVSTKLYINIIIFVISIIIIEILRSINKN